MMEHFIVSARKYRPESFEDVVGQQAITNTLQNAINNNHLAQALLFTGPRGVGKTTCARILAKKINQQDHNEIEQDFAFNIFELDAASNNSVDDIRSLTDQVRIPPQTGKYKVYIIDEVHMLSTSAFNAFLKTLEEPPKHAIFILATTEKHKIIPTILSRCQIFDFKRISVLDAKNHLAKIAQQEGVEAEDDALHIIAQKADGAMRDALSIYDRVVSFSGSNLTRQAVAENLNVLDYEVYFEATTHILNQNIPQLLLQFNSVLAKGFDGQHFIAGLAAHFRDLFICKEQSTIPLLEVGEQTKKKYFEQAQLTNTNFLKEAIELANACDLKYKSTQNQRLLVELCLMQLASITEGKKKNAEPYIIPASNFVSVKKEQKQVIETQEHAHAKVDNVKDQKTPYKQDHNPPPVSNLNKVNSKAKPKAVSGLSLKSIDKKKELKQKKLQREENQPKKLNETFTESEALLAWDEYVLKLKNKGEKILASILETDRPSLKDKTLHITLPNSTMKVELERAQGPLISYIRNQVKNSFVDLSITVNEEVAKKYAFTSREKFDKLVQKNNNLEKLRRLFDLDIK